MASHAFIVSYLLSPGGGQKVTIADLRKGDLGGWNGSNKVADITGASISGTTLSFSKGGGDWAAVFGGSGHNDTCHACLWCWIEGYGPPHWFGGKFEWCRADASSVGMSNIKEGYHGWGWNAITAAKKYKFGLCNPDTGACTNQYEWSK